MIFYLFFLQELLEENESGGEDDSEIEDVEETERQLSEQSDTDHDDSLEDASFTSV